MDNLKDITKGKAVVKEEQFRHPATDEYEYYGRLEVDGNRVCVFDDDCDDCVPELFAEAFNVAQSTGKSPQMLADERDELLQALRIALIDLEQAQEETHIDFRGSIDHARATLSKHKQP